MSTQYTQIPADLKTKQDRAKKLEGEACSLRYEVEEELLRRAAALLAITQQRLELEYAGCTGPLGACVYDFHEDPAHDCCLFCQQPSERK